MKFIIRIFALMFVVSFTGCSGNKDSSTTKTPTNDGNLPHPSTKTKLPSPNLVCKGQTKDNRAIVFEAEITGVRPSTEQPTKVEFGTSNLLIRVNQQTISDLSGLTTMIAYLTTIGGYVSSFSFGVNAFDIEWSLWVDSKYDLREGRFVLIRNDPNDHAKPGEEVGHVICRSSR